jgi:hypothetical protein
VTVLFNGSFNWEHVPWRRPALFDQQPGIADSGPPPNPCPAIRLGGIDGIAAGLEKDSPRMHDMIYRRVRAFLQGLAAVKQCAVIWPKSGQTPAWRGTIVA